MRYLLLSILLANCAGNVAVKPDAPAPLNKSWPNAEWAEYAYEKVAVLPRTSDEKEFCPQGLTRANWVHLLAAMSRYESNFKPTLEYKERFKNGRGEYVISTGLFQVSYESSRGYGFKGITTKELKDPYKNIDVAVSILKKWTLRDGVVANHSGSSWRGGSRYWSVLRPSGKLQAVKDYLKPLCQ